MALVLVSSSPAAAVVLVTIEKGGPAAQLGGCGSTAHSCGRCSNTEQKQVWPKPAVASPLYQLTGINENNM